MKKHYYLPCLLLLFSALSIAQSKFEPVEISTGKFLGETQPLRDFESVPEGIPEDWRIIPNNMRNAPNVNPDAKPVGEDPVLQKNPPFRQGREVLQSFTGLTRGQAGGAIPPDPTGAVGPNHYVHAVNLAIRVFDKTGAPLTGVQSLAGFFGNGVNSGDPIVLYDQLADRWFVSQFRVDPGPVFTPFVYIAISTSNDPTDTYNVYEFNLGSFPDYPHYTVWPDAYYLTANKGGQTTFAFERDVMIAGGANPQLVGFNLPGIVRNPNTVFSPEPANLLGTTAPADVPGYIVYLQDDAWSGAITFDHIKIWEIDLDWANTGNSTISAPVEIPTEPFNSTFFAFGTGDVQQPGTNVRIDNIGGVISYMANYRSFAGHNSFLLNFNVNLGGAIRRSGIRWIELRNTGTGPWSIYQQGTYSINDGDGRFMGSMAMDVDGNIGLAYNRGSIDTRVGLYYTGRMANDPLGEMTIAEQTLQEGNGIQTVTNRFGDYAHLTMDPDGVTFWHTGEYFASNNLWATNISAFNLENTLSVADNTLETSSLSVISNSLGSYDLIVSTTEDLGDLNFDVYSIEGRKIMQGALTNEGNIHRQTISSNALSNGVYIVNVFNSKGFESSEKFIVKQ